MYLLSLSYIYAYYTLYVNTKHSMFTFFIKYTHLCTCYVFSIITLIVYKRHYHYQLSQKKHSFIT